MPAYPTLIRALRATLAIGAVLGTLATCGDGPTDPPDPPPSLVAADTLTLDFASRQTLDVQPIPGTGQRLVVRMFAPHAGDSLAVRRVQAGVSVDSVIVVADTAGALMRSMWIPRALSASALEISLRWIRRDGATTVTAYLLPPTDDPEHAPRILVVGDTVVEYLDGDSDLDRFVVPGAVGQRIAVWAQLDSASQPIRLRMRTYNGTTTPGDRQSALTSSAVVPLADVKELDFYTQVSVTLQAAAGTVGSPAQIEARYRVWAALIDRAPETANALVVPGDTVRERIDKFGDVDRFRVPSTIGQEFRVFLARDSLSPSTLRARLTVNGEAPIPFTLAAADSVLDLTRSQWIQHYDENPAVIEVLGDEGAQGDIRPVAYRLMYQLRARAPETAPVNLALIDSVVTENLSSCADQDEFEIHGAPLTFVSVGAVLHANPGCRVRVRLMAGEGQLDGIDSLRLGTDTDAGRWPPWPIPHTGVLRFRIEGVDAPGQPIGRVPAGYMLDVYTVDSMPEIAPTALPLGDSLVTETIHRCADRDKFEIVGPPGSVVAVTAGFGRATTCGIALSSENSGSGFFHSGDNGDAMRFGHIVIPASGRAPLVVATERTGARADRGAPYFVTTNAINTAPELGPATLALGDTVQETFSRCGDIDRWQVPLVQGQGVWFRFDRARSSSCLVVVKLEYAANQRVHYELWPTDTVAPVLQHYLPPETATYTLEVLTIPAGHTDDRNLPYSVVVTGAQNEIAPSALAVGDTSAIEPTHLHDLDLFVVPLQAGRDYVASALGEVSFTAHGPTGWSEYSYEGYPRGPQLVMSPTVSGDYRFRVATGSQAPMNFRFMVHQLDRTPETIPDTLTDSDTTAVEFIEFPGDQDNFAIGLAPGRYFRLESFLSAGTTGTLSAWVGAGNAILAYSTNSGDWTTGRARVPAGGGVGVILQDYLVTADTTTRPSYRLRLVEIDPAPESRSAVLAPTDSVLGESMDDPYDLDEYQFTVTTSGTYSVRLQAAGAACGQLWMRVLNSQGAELATFMGRTDAASTGTIVLAAGTTYTLVVEAADPFPAACVMHPYKTKLMLQP